jgi:hypothetical protein
MQCVACSINLSLGQAVHIAQNSESVVDRRIAALLEEALKMVWGRLQAEPESYIFSPDEFALVNYYIPQLGEEDLVQNAVKRYWDCPM